MTKSKPKSKKAIKLEERGRVQFNMEMLPEMRDQIEEMAKAEGLSAAQVIRKAVRREYKKFHSENQAYTPEDTH